MKKIVLLLSFIVLFMAYSPKLFAQITPSGGSGQIFAPRNNLPMGGFVFTGEGAATANQQPCTYGQSTCKTEIVNNAFAAASLPGGKPVGTQELVTDWNGTAGVCVGGGSNISLAAFNGSNWICFGGSGGSVSNINVNIVSWCAGSGKTSGSYAAYETMSGTAQKVVTVFLNAYRNTTSTPDQCVYPIPFVDVAVISPNSVPASSTTLTTLSLPINMSTATETALEIVNGL